MIERKDVQLAISLTTGRGNKTVNEYRLAMWLREQGYQFDMSDLRELLGAPGDQIDDEVRRGINGTLERMGS